MKQLRPDRRAMGATRCAAFRRALKRLERARPLSADAEPASCEAEQALLKELGGHVGDCRRCQGRYGARLNALEALRTLGGREVPAGMLDDLYDSIQQRMPLTPAGGGMTLAFLDAPRQLRMWRTAALAASLVLVVGTGFLATGGLSFSAGTTGPRERPFHDPRERMLEALDVQTKPSDPGLRLMPLPDANRRGRADFFRSPDAQPVEYERGWK